MKTNATRTTKTAATLLAMVTCVLALFVSGSAGAQIASTPRELEHVGVTEHLDGPLPLETAFRDHTGAPVTLGKYFDGRRPVVLQFAYHTCPVVCGMITTNLAAGLKGVPWTIGKEFDVITISIDPNESLEKTVAKRTSILNDYGREHTSKNGGWHFLTGDARAIDAVTKAAGFEYQYDERQKQWGHPSVVFVVKPNGRMARYLYGLEFPAADLRLGLLEASEGRHITTVEKLILYCYHYDPQGGKYVLVARRVMQVGGGAVAVVLFGFLGLFWARELRKKNEKSAPKGGSGGASGSPDETSSSRSRLDSSELVITPPPRGEPISVRGG
ncbi:MAG TPA: SCO family protein [Labilithrix sp.]|nr:SCO family protein [Labilithrix sp.]